MTPKTRARSASGTQSPARNAQARKRRISIDDDHDDTPEDGQIQARTVAEETKSTPRKVVKRVRFSDLGPELASTGLTPWVRRTTLSPSTSDLRATASDPARRRRSLPPSLPSLSANEQTSPTIERIQFTPLRQMLDPRLKRRLRRSHLSEEINNFQDDQRALNRAQTELVHLRDQEEQRQETIRQLTFDLELQRQLGIEVNVEEEQRMQELQLELADWKARAEQVRTEAGENFDAMDNTLDLPANDENDAKESSTEPSSPWQEETFFSSPTSRRVMDMSSPIPISKSQSASTHASCQVGLPDSSHEEQVTAYENAVRRLTQESSDAKSALEMVKKELYMLGFSAENTSDEDIVSGLREAFRSARMQLEHLLPGETAGGTEHGDFMLTSMLAHLKKLVEAVKADKKTIDRQEQTETALRGQFNATVKKATDLEQRVAVIDSHRTTLIHEIQSKEEELEEARREVEVQEMEVKKGEKQITQLEAEAEEQCTSVNRLQAALITYRDEVTSLESLVIKMESSNVEKDSELAILRSQLQDAVSENEATCQKLAKLRQDVQYSAFELSALAKPDLKANVTQRRNRHTEPSLSGKKQSDDKLAGKQLHGNKRDSGVAMNDDPVALLRMARN